MEELDGFSLQPKTSMTLLAILLAFLRKYFALTNNSLVSLDHILPKTTMNPIGQNIPVICLHFEATTNMDHILPETVSIDLFAS